jgi:hypothetical protein
MNIMPFDSSKSMISSNCSNQEALTSLSPELDFLQIQSQSSTELKESLKEGTDIKTSQTASPIFSSLPEVKGDSLPWEPFLKLSMNMMFENLKEYLTFRANFTHSLSFVLCDYAIVIEQKPVDVLKILREFYLESARYKTIPYNYCEFLMKFAQKIIEKTCGPDSNLSFSFSFSDLSWENFKSIWDKQSHAFTSIPRLNDVLVLKEEGEKETNPLNALSEAFDIQKKAITKRQEEKNHILDDLAIRKKEKKWGNNKKSILHHYDIVTQEELKAFEMNINEKLKKKDRFGFNEEQKVLEINEKTILGCYDVFNKMDFLEFKAKYLINSSSDSMTPSQPKEFETCNEALTQDSAHPDLSKSVEFEKVEINFNVESNVQVLPSQSSSNEWENCQISFTEESKRQSSTPHSSPDALIFHME